MIFLDKLTIFKNGDILREINFKKGLNLITNSFGVGRTGNGVGKTTLPRVVDFIFMGQLDVVYVDPEYKEANKEIKGFFEKNDVMATLLVSRGEHKRKSFSRTLNIKSSDQVYFVDERIVPKSEYEESLRLFVFNVESDRPSLRFLAPKFLRHDSHKMLHTTHFLDKRTSNSDYSEVLLYLFGFHDTNALSEKRKMKNNLKKRKENLKALNSIVKEQNLARDIKEYRENVESLQQSLLKFEYSQKYSDPVGELSKLQAMEDGLAHQILSVERKISNINLTVDDFLTKKDKYLLDELLTIYEYAGVTIDRGVADLKEAMSFHRRIVEKKRFFLERDLPILKAKLKELKDDIERAKKQKSDIFADMRSKQSIDRITDNLRRLGELNVELGKLEGLLEQQTVAKHKLEAAGDQYENILEEIQGQIILVKSFIAVINVYFLDLAKSLLSEEYTVFFDFDSARDHCDVYIENGATNPEGGKKKLEVISFDLSYIQAVHHTGYVRPSFVFHDSIEDVDSKQILEIFEYSETFPGQHIISMLSDKLSAEDFEKYKSSMILVLDENNKFFGV